MPKKSRPEIQFTHTEPEDRNAHLETLLFNAASVDLLRHFAHVDFIPHVRIVDCTDCGDWVAVFKGIEGELHFFSFDEDGDFINAFNFSNIPNSPETE